jgi:hypothetical protein
MKNLITLSALTLLLTSCSSVLVFTPGDIIQLVLLYLAASYVMAMIYTTDGRNSFRKYLIVNLFLTPLLGYMYYKSTKVK